MSEPEPVVACKRKPDDLCTLPPRSSRAELKRAKRAKRAAEKKALVEKNAFKVVYEDSTVVIVVKPQGMPTIGGVNSLASSDGLMKHSYPKADKSKALADHSWQPRPADALNKARPVHRLDSATGGLVICAKNHASLVGLSQNFKDKTVHKRYRAIVFGKMQGDSGRVEVPIDGKESRTRHSVPSTNKPKLTRSLYPRWKLVSVSESSVEGGDGFISTVDLWPETGR